MIACGNVEKVENIKKEEREGEKRRQSSYATERFSNDVQ